MGGPENNVVVFTLSREMIMKRLVTTALATASFAAVALLGVANAAPIAPLSAAAAVQSSDVVLAHYYHGHYYGYYHNHHYYHHRHYRHHHWYYW